ncbi:MAG: nicotinamide-nucleotide amidohydrolase family protein [Candidatus Omnitrophica bacterium]|nr:nicotinamide-nucleotide amidohydrolase family protein [Candidatus Omnitrophota bacterium]
MEIVPQLRRLGLTVAAAESCTAGYLSSLLTRTSGSSRVFLGGWIVYTPAAKRILCGLPEEEVRRVHGVSAPLAGRLAEGIRHTLHSDIGIAVVGFAGPDAPRPGDVGTGYIGLSTARRLRTEKFFITGNRNRVRVYAARRALSLLDDELRAIRQGQK